MTADRAEAYRRLIEDLAAETAAVRGRVDELSDDELLAPTPAQGWTIRDQLTHLAGFDDAAALAMSDPDAASRSFADAFAQGADPIAAVTERGRAQDPGAGRTWFHEARARFLAVAAATAPETRVPWFGPPMSAMSKVTARLMETWAHGLDISDALGEAPEATRRLRHIAHIGVGARGFAFAARGLPAPSDPIRVELAGPNGETWTWGPPDAADRVSGPALDFCLLVTQRRHRDDVDLAAVGEAATGWLAIAQAFAGPPGAGRTPGQFPRT